MVNPIEAGDPRRALASNKFYQDLNNLNHRLDILSGIPFDVPVIIIQRWVIQGFNAYPSTIVAQVYSMDEDYLNCTLYTCDQKYIVLNREDTNGYSIKLPFSGVIQWRLLDSAFLGTTINWPVKTCEYSNLF